MLVLYLVSECFVCIYVNYLPKPFIAIHCFKINFYCHDRTQSGSGLYLFVSLGTSCTLTLMRRKQRLLMAFVCGDIIQLL